jgi:hypothetical protein
MSDTILGDKPAPNSLCDYGNGPNVTEKYMLRLIADDADLDKTLVRVRWELFYGCHGSTTTVFKGSYPSPAEAAQAGADAIKHHREGFAHANELAVLMARYNRI